MPRARTRRTEGEETPRCRCAGAEVQRARCKGRDAKVQASLLRERRCGVGGWRGGREKLRGGGGTFVVAEGRGGVVVWQGQGRGGRAEVAEQRWQRQRWQSRSGGKARERRPGGLFFGPDRRSWRLATWDQTGSLPLPAGSARERRDQSIGRGRCCVCPASGSTAGRI